MPRPIRGPCSPVWRSGPGDGARARGAVPEMVTSDLGMDIGADVVRAEAVRIALQSLP